MAIPDYQTLMLPVLRLAAEGEQCVPDAAERIADDLGLSTEEREERLSSGQRLLHNRIHWAKLYMSRAGLLSSPRRGRFIATDEGRALLASSSVRIDVDRLKNYGDFLEFYNGRRSDDGEVIAAAPSAENGTPEEQIEVAYKAMQSALRTELLERIVENSPAFFEQLIVDLLVAMGYGGSYGNAATRLGRSGDGGVDGVINEDRLGLDRVYVQAKRYALDRIVGRPDVQGFVGSLMWHGAAKGVFVTTSAFSSQAQAYVQDIKQQRVVLIDGGRLANLMIEYGLGVRVRRTVEFKRLDEDFFTEE